MWAIMSDIAVSAKGALDDPTTGYQTRRYRSLASVSTPLAHFILFFIPTRPERYSEMSAKRSTSNKLEQAAE